MPLDSAHKLMERRIPLRLFFVLLAIGFIIALIGYAAFTLALKAAAPVHAQEEFSIQAQAVSGQGVRVSWKIGNGPRVLDVTLCTTEPGDSGFLFKLNCFWHETRYNPGFGASDSSVLAPRVVSFPYYAFPILLTRDGNLHLGPALLVWAPGKSVAAANTNPLLESLPLSASGITAKAAVGLRWDTGEGPMFAQISTCRTEGTTNGQPYTVFCAHSTSPGQKLLSRGWEVGGGSQTDPHWAFAVGLTEDGDFMVSNLVFVDPNYLSVNDTYLVLHGQVDNPKEEYAAGETLTYRAYLWNTGNVYSKSPLALLATSYENRGLKLLSAESPFETQQDVSGDPNRPGVTTYVDPRGIDPGDEELVLTIKFEVVKTHYQVVSIGSSLPWTYDLPGTRYNFQAHVAD